MTAARQTTVVSVAAAPGGGKTTVSNLLAAKLDDAPVLHYDDYETLTAGGVPALTAWLERGARFEDIPLPGFAEQMTKLIAGTPRYLIIDAPVGRSHPATAGKIDFFLYIDTPLDLALARVVREQARRAANLPDAAARNFVVWLETYLDSYSSLIRRGLDAQRATIMPRADLVLDGTLPPARLVELALLAMRERGF